MTESLRKKIRQSINQQWVKFCTQHKDSTVQGVKRFIHRNTSYEGVNNYKSRDIGDKISAKSMQVIFSSHSILSHLVVKEEFKIFSDVMHKLNLNGYQLMVIRIAGKY